MDPLFPSFLKQLIVELLDVCSAQLLQFPSFQSGTNVVLDVLGIVKPGERLNPVQVLPLPDLQPLTHCHLGRFQVFVVVYINQRGLHFLPHFFLGLS